MEKIVAGAGSTIKAEVDTAICAFRRFFLNRTDRVGFLPPWGADGCPVVGDNNLDALLTAHLLGEAVAPVGAQWITLTGKTGRVTGRFRIGSYSPTPGSSLTVYGAIDCDGGGRHSAPLKDPLGVALQILRAAERLGLPAYLECSGSGKGWHVWLFFDGPVSAKKVRQLLFGLIPTDALLADDSPADARANRGVEVFPKQDILDPNGIGNMVWLPWWHGAAEGGNLFYRVGDDGELAPYVPELFDGRDSAC